ncbi:MAG: hypothetical protein HQL33_09650 [Alphaproteobacteria bacterium]|nr:hypothetical protein [Alphaproteobacteria bacterium]MBF0130246.1 hypothetical protein [Alphaproteobacteria bacterium]
MTRNEPDAIEVREIVGVFADRERFEGAIEALVGSGFRHGDISVLSSHDPIEALEPPGKTVREILLPFLDEMRYDAPLVAAGLIALAGGPTAALVAGLVAAGIGGVAVKKILSEVVAAPHTDNFQRALEAGSLILWVAVEDAGREAEAREVFARFGAENVHDHAHRVKG